MVHTLEIGDKRKFWPAPGRQVQSRAGMFGRFLDENGEDLIVDEWVIDRVRDGSMLMHEPGEVVHPKRLSDSDAIRLCNGELKHCPETGALVEAAKWDDHVAALAAKASALPVVAKAAAIVPDPPATPVPAKE